MSGSDGWKPDPKLDLVLERVVDVAPELVWAAWTKPEHVPHWLAPRPWTISHCEIDLRPGGIFHFVVHSPEGAGTRYIATAIHRDPEGRTKHEEMGFHEGWSQVLDQLVEYAKTM